MVRLVNQFMDHSSDFFFSMVIHLLCEIIEEVKLYKKADTKN